MRWLESPQNLKARPAWKSQMEAVSWFEDIAYLAFKKLQWRSMIDLVLHQEATRSTDDVLDVTRDNAHVERVLGPATRFRAVSGLRKPDCGSKLGVMLRDIRCCVEHRTLLLLVLTHVLFSLSHFKNVEACHQFEAIKTSEVIAEEIQGHVEAAAWATLKCFGDCKGQRLQARRIEGSNLW